jgi:Lamin Tail Domain/Calcineurin-like phosphoesterase
MRHLASLAVLAALAATGALASSASAAIVITKIYYDSPGPDRGTNKSLDAEWIRLKNTGGKRRSLRSWTIRNAAGHLYKFGRYSLKAGKSVTIHTGRGTNTATNRYWGRRRYVWNNRKDTARLRNERGTLIARCSYNDASADYKVCFHAGGGGAQPPLGVTSPAQPPVDTAPPAQPPLDTTPPAMPTNLTASAGDGEVTLNWTANTEADLNHYNLYRDGAEIASPTSATYTDSGVTNGTTYSYQVTAVDNAGNESASSASASATPRASSSTADPVITAAGDICGSTTDCRATSDLNLEINPTKMLTLGDNAYNDGSLTDYMSFYDPNWGRFKANTKPVTGNHEFHIANAQGFHDYFGAIAPDQYYSYDIGSWHFVALASSAGISPSAGGPEETWLRADLAAHPNQCTVAYWHEPRWSSGTGVGSDSSWNAVWQDLYASHVELVLNGHEHNYERFAPQTPSGLSDPRNGIVEVVSGTGGASLSADFGTPIANSAVRNDNTFGLTKVTLHQGSYDLDFQPIAGQTFMDHYAGSCH